MARRIQSEADLKDVLDSAEIDMAQELLDHDCWVVCQRWSKDGPDIEPELHGPESGGAYSSAEEALIAREEIHANGLNAAGWIEIHGDPITQIVPVWKKGS